MSVSILPQTGNDAHLGAGWQALQDESIDHTLDTDWTKNQLRALWAEILQQDPADFSEQDEFFEVGGDSISALDLATAAQEQGIFLTIEQIFLHVTLEEMAREALATKDRKRVPGPSNNLEPFGLLRTEISLPDQIGVIAKACSITPERVKNAYPCTPMQESLVALSDGNENLSVRQLVYKLADVPLDRFQQAWGATARANHVLRTRIFRLEGEFRYLQAVIDEDVLWSTVNTDLNRFLEQDVGLPMKLGDPFFRYTIVVDSDDKGQSQKYFVWTVHHALCDGASILEILDEVAKRFVNEPTFQRQPFEQFIKSTIRIDSSEEQEFWERSLSGIEATPYPPLPQDIDFHANPSSTLERTITLAERPSPFGLTKALLLRAAWGILLSHHTGTQDVVFGAIGNGRTSPAVAGISQVTGPTINLLPIALQVDPKQSVASFLARVRAQAADLMAFEQSGISKIRNYLAGRGSTAADFQTLFVVHSTEFGEAGALALRSLGLEYMSHAGKAEQHSYPLVVSLTLSTDTSTGFKIQYDDRVVSTQQAHNLINQFQAVLLRLSSATKDTLLESISSLSDQDVAQISQWNQSTPVAEATCIHHLFEQRVYKEPNAIAVCSLEQFLSYAEMDNISSSLALRLMELGVGLETFVAVCFEKSIWTVVAIMAVFKAGGIYVPIDPAHPRGRIVEVIGTVQIKFGIASKAGSAVLDGLCDSIITIDNPPLCYATSLAKGLRTKVRPSNTAYLLFTSGSTGKPKGVLMSHSAMCTSILHHGPAFGASPNWRTLQFAAHTFDISMTEFFTTLAFGGCICVPSEYDRLNDLAGAITALNINVALVVPTVANLISPENVPTLTTLVLGGEPVTKETISRWANSVHLIAGYGPSETAVYCSGNLKASANAHPADIGRSIGATMWIANADNHHQLSAIGCVGEIVISGPLLGMGYFGDQATTDASFVPAPEWLKKIKPSSFHKMLYKTGDLARYNSDGTFRIVGRRDTQVKLRGFRIELGEIENRIMEDGTVIAALSTLPKTGPCARQIVAVICFNRSDLGNHAASDIILSTERQASKTTEVLEKVKSRLSLTLPDYMIPSVWVVLERMPLLLSGKIDRKSIKLWVDDMTADTYRELVEEVDDGGLVEVSPGTSAATIQKIWSEVLKVSTERIGMKTSFFALGGDSIAAIQVVSKAKEIGLPVTVRGILSQKTLGNLANFVDQSRPAASSTPEQDIVPNSSGGLLDYSQVLQSRLEDKPAVKIEDSYPLTPIQREIMKQREIDPAIFVLAWNMEISLRNSQEISLDRLAQSWKGVVQRNHILRSIFLKNRDKKLPPLQVVLSNAEPEVATSSLAAEDPEPALDEILPPLDECFLPHRAHFYQHGDKFFGQIEFDHLVIDGWSFKLIKEDLLAAYDIADTQLPVTPSLFKSVVKAHQPDLVDLDRKYWASILRDQRPALLSFPATQQASKKLSGPKKTIIYLPVLEVEALSAFGARHSITTASIFDAAWAQTLSIYTQSSDVSFEYVVSGRDHDVPGIFEIVGPVMNLLAYHLRDISTEGSSQALADLAHTMQEQRLQDGPHNLCNIREVLEDDLKLAVPFNTALNFQRRPLGVHTESLKVYDHLDQSSDPWHFDILVRVMHLMDNNVIRPSIEFDPRIFDRNQLQKVAETFWERVQIAIA